MKENQSQPGQALVLPQRSPANKNGALVQRPDHIRRIWIYNSIGTSLVWLLCTLVKDETKHRDIKGHVGSIMVNLAELDLGCRVKLKI